MILDSFFAKALYRVQWHLVILTLLMAFGVWGWANTRIDSARASKNGLFIEAFRSQRKFSGTVFDHRTGVVDRKK